jgi:hypothetical protein
LWCEPSDAGAGVVKPRPFLFSLRLFTNVVEEVFCELRKPF